MLPNFTLQESGARRDKRPKVTQWGNGKPGIAALACVAPRLNSDSLILVSSWSLTTCTVLTARLKRSLRTPGNDTARMDQGPTESHRSHASHNVCTGSSGFPCTGTGPKITATPKQENASLLQCLQGGSFQGMLGCLQCLSSTCEAPFSQTDSRIQGLQPTMLSRIQ